MLAAKLRKEVKYVSLILDLEISGLTVTYMTGDWITLPIHQECKQKHSNTPPRHSSSNCQEIFASGSKNIHQVFSNAQIHPAWSSSLPLFIPWTSIGLSLFIYLFIVYLFVCLLEKRLYVYALFNVFLKIKKVCL